MKKTTFQKLFKWVIICTIFVLMTACISSEQATRVVHDTRIDTLYLNRQQYDSIYVYQDRFIDRSRDTLYVKDKSIEYRYRLLRDTVHLVQCDSIPYEVVITEVKEIARPLTWYDTICRSSLWLLIGTLIYWICRNLKFMNLFRTLFH